MNDVDEFKATLAAFPPTPGALMPPGLDLLLYKMLLELIARVEALELQQRTQEGHANQLYRNALKAVQSGKEDKAE